MNEKSLERVVSQKAFQMGNSFPCQICVLGFFCGVCLTTLFLAAITTFAIGQTPFSYISMGFSPSNSSSRILSMATSHAHESRSMEAMGKIKLLEGNEKSREEQESLLYSAWTTLLGEPTISDTLFLQKFGLSKSALPKAPHLETCQIRTSINKRLDSPSQMSRKGLPSNDSSSTRDERLSFLAHRGLSRGFYPPWITGSDEENYPMTRRVQHDIWIHQHPLNCSDADIKFLVADWERPPGFGIGAQLAEMCSLLAIVINEKRVLVTNYYNRADHDGCKGSSRASWSCYFLPETSQECRDRAMKLLGRQEALDKGIVTTKDSYSSKNIWTVPTPRIWGNPWSYLRPTTEINGSLVVSHRKMDRRWWRAQAARYLMRFQAEYTCGLLNAARHAAFGREAASMVVATLESKWPQDSKNSARSGIEKFVWSNHKPWIPSPLLSMHVRMGDKACEMKVVQFEDYMLLAERIRKRFPQLTSIWLSTEMQEVIEKSKQYRNWKFYYTNVTRQVGNMTMATYEASLGRETSTNYPLVNFIMATESNFFVGALGSTWCFLIDGMRNTGGKVMAGYLSVNKDQFW